VERPVGRKSVPWASQWEELLGHTLAAEVPLPLTFMLLVSSVPHIFSGDCCNSERVQDSWKFSKVAGGMSQLAGYWTVNAGQTFFRCNINILPLS
jgi:hypothetical protein